MRRSYISPEFEYNDVYGTFNMVEKSTFFGSKMLEVEDSIYIENNNIIYFQNSNGEQIDFSSESILDPNIYTSPESKLKYHKISIDETQTNYQRENSTMWIIDINLKSILLEFIYSEMKRSRTFEGIRNNMTINNDVNSSLRNYIGFNVLNRYKISRVDLYLEYRSLLDNNILRFDNTWDENIYKSVNQFKKFETQTSYDNSSIKILFSQQQPSKLYNFKYYFNLLFEKI